MAEVAAYVKLTERLTSEKRTLDYLVEQDAADRTETMETLDQFKCWIIFS